MWRNNCFISTTGNLTIKLIYEFGRIKDDLFFQIWDFANFEDINMFL